MIRAAEAKRGTTANIFLPHPDDIVIDSERGVRLIGPMNATEQAMMEDTIRFRDLLLVQDLHDRRDYGEPDPDDPEGRPGVAILLCHALNNSLPKRHQLSTLDMINSLTPYERMTMRKLRKTLFQRWRAHSRSVRRGTTLGSMADGKLLLTTFYEAVRRAITD